MRDNSNTDCRSRVDAPSAERVHHAHVVASEGLSGFDLNAHDSGSPHRAVTDRDPTLEVFGAVLLPSLAHLPQYLPRRPPCIMRLLLFLLWPCYVLATIFDLSDLDWTLLNQNGSIAVPGSIPSQAHLDLVRAGVITEPLLGLNGALRSLYELSLI